MERHEETRYQVLKNMLVKIAISAVLIGAFALFCAITLEICLHGEATETYVTVKSLMK